MTEKEFWTKYSRAEYLHSTKNVIAAAAEAAEDEELAVFLKQDDMLVNEARKKVFYVNVILCSTLSQEWPALWWFVFYAMIFAFGSVLSYEFFS